MKSLRMTLNNFKTFFTFLLLAICLINCDDTDPINPPVTEEEITPTPPTTTPETDPVTNQPTIAFYNVENLFDTIDDPENGGDNEFLPTAAKQWTVERYEHKLNNIAKVIKGMNYPIVMGLCEVENEKVVEDITKEALLSDYQYAVVHEQSPDHRGIDVALIYQPSVFELLEWKTYQVNIPDEQIANFTTRDILLVKGQIAESIVYVFVNHWPSRSGGEAATEARRTYVAAALREAIDDLQESEPNAKIIVMGDLNDEPTNKSVAEVLQAKTAKEGSIIVTDLYNCTSDLDMAGEGSYNYQGNWQMIDQIISTGNLLSADSSLSISNFQIYKEEPLLFNHPDNGLTPDRTYGGDTFYGGFSDHLPVFLEVTHVIFD